MNKAVWKVTTGSQDVTDSRGLGLESEAWLMRTEKLK